MGILDVLEDVSDAETRDLASQGHLRAKLNVKSPIEKASTEPEYHHADPLNGRNFED